MKKIESFHDLEVWQGAKKVAIEVITMCKEKPLKNEFGLRDQIIRSAFSIASNIAEGYEYSNNNDFVRFLRYSKGSVGELRSQLLILKEAGLVGEQGQGRLDTELQSISRQIGGFAKYLRSHKETEIKKS